MGRPSSRFASLSTAAANIGWHASRGVARAIPRASVRVPAWAPGPPPASSESSGPSLGLPRKTQSLCPKCNRKAVDAVVNGAASLTEFRDRPGVIDASVVEENGRVVMRKTCAEHGTFEDVLSTDSAFFRRMESLYAGQDFRCDDEADVAHHGVTAIKSGRGVVLIVDLTNRCNLKCSPCFMDANHAPYVHELSMDEIRQSSIERARSSRGATSTFCSQVANRRSLTVSSTRPLRAEDRLRTRLRRHERHSVWAGRRLRRAGPTAGLHQVYLQFDGTSNQQHFHRGAGNLFDVKQRALERIAAAGMKTNLQVTVMNGVNNRVVGDIVRFAIDNIDKVRSVLFQPIMFTGRDADVSDEVRRARRYTLADLPHDLKRQFGSCEWEPMRDWFPMSVYSVFGRLFDALYPNAARGSLNANVHPNQGIVSPLLVNQSSKQVVPISSFVDVDGLLRDIATIADSGSSIGLMRAQLALAVLRRFNQRRAPDGFTIADLRALLERFLPRFRSDVPNWSGEDNLDPQWRLLMVAGLWFQDLFNYDFSVIGMDAVRTATFPGEISFCAYNSAGWRQVTEHVHQTATLAEWHRSRGRHQIYTNGAFIPALSIKEANLRQPQA